MKENPAATKDVELVEELAEKIKKVKSGQAPIGNCLLRKRKGHMKAAKEETTKEVNHALVGYHSKDNQLRHSIRTYLTLAGITGTECLTAPFCAR